MPETINFISLPVSSKVDRLNLVPSARRCDSVLHFDMVWRLFFAMVPLRANNAWPALSRLERPGPREAHSALVCMRLNPNLNPAAPQPHRGPAPFSKPDPQFSALPAAGLPEIGLSSNPPDCPVPVCNSPEKKFPLVGQKHMALTENLQHFKPVSEHNPQLMNV